MAHVVPNKAVVPSKRRRFLGDHFRRLRGHFGSEVAVCIYVTYIYFGLSPLPVRVTTRIITFLVGNPYKPLFATITGWGVDPTYTVQRIIICLLHISNNFCISVFLCISHISCIIKACAWHLLRVLCTMTR